MTAFVYFSLGLELGLFWIDLENIGAAFSLVEVVVNSKADISLGVDFSTKQF